MIAAMLLMAAAPLDFLTESGDVSVNESRKVVSAYARCVIRKRRALASSAVLSTVNNSDLIRTHRQLIDEDCVDAMIGKMAFAGDLFRYAMADALLRDEISVEPLLDFKAAPPLVHYAPEKYPTPIDDKGRRLSKKKYNQSLEYFATSLAFAQVSKLGECVVRESPAASRALLLTDVVTPAEGAAMAPLNPALANCLDRGERMTLTREVLRGTIALNYYRLSKATLKQGVVR